MHETYLVTRCTTVN